MIKLFGKTYAKNNSEFVNSLFSQQTCNGYYKHGKKGIHLYNIQKEVIAFIKTPTAGESAFIVSCYVFNGKKRYLFGLDTITEKYLNCPISYRMQIEELAHLFNR